MSDAHPLRTGIIATTIGGVLATVILSAAGFAGVVWRGLQSAVSWGWHQFTAPICLPEWLVLAVVVYAVVVTMLLRRRGAPSESPPDEPAAFRPGGPPQAPRELDKLQAKVMRAMGEADGGTPTVEDLANDLGVSQLRLEQTLEELEAIGYVEIIRHIADGPVVDVTRAGRDYLIAKRLV